MRIQCTIHMYSGITRGRVLDGELLYFIHNSMYTGDKQYLKMHFANSGLLVKQVMRWSITIKF